MYSSKTKWKGVVGLEIHAQILTKSKLFSGAATNFAAPVNSNVALFDASIPGTLPILNKKCVEAGIKTASALSCHINAISMFDRKHYFYADLPSGYQITQQRAPLAQKGIFTFPVFVPGVTKIPYEKTVRLTQLQLEQDSGKSLHDEYAGRSLVDLNRAGVPLMELVFEPDLENGEEAAALVKELILILTRLKTCSCKMEEGALRVDANISVHKKGDPLGIRTEVKNIGSIRGVAQAVQYEIQRQTELLNRGECIHNETRSWDAVSRKTIAMRDKEVLQDYRFMPEPNLPPLHLNTTGTKDARQGLLDVVNIQKTLPELPKETRRRLMDDFQLKHENAIILVNEDILLKCFESIMTEKPTRSPKNVINILLNEILRICNKEKLTVDKLGVKANSIGEIVDLIENETINLHLAKLIIEQMIKNPKISPSKVCFKSYILY